MTKFRSAGRRAENCQQTESWRTTSRSYPNIILVVQRVNYLLCTHGPGDDLKLQRNSLSLYAHRTGCHPRTHGAHCRAKSNLTSLAFKLNYPSIKLLCGETTVNRQGFLGINTIMIATFESWFLEDRDVTENRTLSYNLYAAIM
jgi:hypothetical protein